MQKKQDLSMKHAWHFATPFLSRSTLSQYQLEPNIIPKDAPVADNAAQAKEATNLIVNCIILLRILAQFSHHKIVTSLQSPFCSF
jgi:hypothetical protein